MWNLPKAAHDFSRNLSKANSISNCLKGIPVKFWNTGKKRHHSAKWQGNGKAKWIIKFMIIMRQRNCCCWNLLGILSGRAYFHLGHTFTELSWPRMGHEWPIQVFLLVKNIWLRYRRQKVPLQIVRGHIFIKKLK